MTTPTERPNLLLITTDQQRFDTIAATGSPHMLTPNLDFLVETGVHFSRCYSDSPVCAPARASLLTGQHYHRMPPGHGHFGQPSAHRPDLTLPAVLTRAGYQTASFGKLHYHPPRCNYGYEHAEILEDYYRYMARHPHLGRPMAHGLGQNQMQPGLATVDEPHTLTHWIVDRAVNFLETRDPTRPFFLNVGFSKPHPPLDPPLAYFLMYQNRPVPDPVCGDWSADPAAIHPGLMGPTWVLNGADRFDPEVIRLVRRAYYSLISQIDYTMGVLLARLRELNLLDTTHIVFTSDHGEMLGDHHMGAKTTYLEPSAHVPLVYRPAKGYGGEALQPGARCDEVVCLADVYRTFTTAAGVTPPADAAPDSLDLAAVAAGTARRDPRGPHPRRRRSARAAARGVRGTRPLVQRRRLRWVHLHQHGRRVPRPARPGSSGRRRPQTAEPPGIRRPCDPRRAPRPRGLRRRLHRAGRGRPHPPPDPRPQRRRTRGQALCRIPAPRARRRSVILHQVRAHS